MPYKPSNTLSLFKSWTSALALIGIFICLSATAFAQEVGGTPITTYWGPRSYTGAAQNWGVAQSKDGVMYFANNSGVLEYNGRNWHLKPTAGMVAVRSLAVAADGTIYVGAVKDFGMLKPNRLGRYEYRSISKEAGLDTPFRDVWDTYCLGNKTYFRTSAGIFVYQKEADIELIKPKTSFHRLYKIGKELFVMQLDVGLMRVEGDSISLVKGGAYFKDRKIYAMMPYGQDQILVCTAKEGAFIFNTKTGARTPWGNKRLNKLLVEGLTYCGAELQDGRYAFGTIIGVIITSREGRILQHIRAKNGLGNEDVLGMGVDDDGALWLGLNSGVARLEVNLPINIYEEEDGPKGEIYAFKKTAGYLYAGGTKGLFRLKAPLDLGGFEHIEDSLNNKTIWDIAEDQGSQDLWLGSDEGLMRYSPQQGFKRIGKSERSVFAIEQFDHYPEYLFLGISGGYAVFDRVRESFIYYTDSLPYKVRHIQSLPSGEVWLGTAYSGFLRIYPHPEKGFEKPIMKKYPMGEEGPGAGRLFRAEGNQLLFGVEAGIYEYSHSSDSLVKSAVFGEGFNRKFRSSLLIKQPDNPSSYWFLGKEEGTNNRLLGRIFKSERGYEWELTGMQRLDFTYTRAALAEKNQKLWLSIADVGIARYNLKEKDRAKPKRPLITQAEVATQIVLNGHAYAPDSLIKFDYQARQPVVFEYTAPYYSRNKDLLFSYKLENYDADWSAWSAGTRKEYTGLWPTKYSFRVRVKDFSGKVSDETALHFEILSPWYLQGWAFILYGLLFIALLWLAFQWNSRRLRNEKRNLERLVNARTAEVQEQNQMLIMQQEEIQAQAENLKEANLAITSQNKKMTDSINYAKRIQQAVQVSQEEMQKQLPESFVWLRPKDIVSGDFFWYTHLPDGKEVIVAADCTGHGVPGAFMSMIGQVLLKEAVLIYNVHEPASVLEMLDHSIRTSLQQGQTHAQDGMDMVVCTVDRQAGLLQFAGAKNPLLIISGEGEPKLVKGSRRSIGGDARLYQNFEFENHTFQIDPNSRYYIFSDGWADQFGGENGKKYTSKRLRATLATMQEVPMTEMPEQLDQILMQWRGYEEQLDDILVVGFKLG